jgi:hypothetical protein
MRWRRVNDIDSQVQDAVEELFRYFIAGQELGISIIRFLIATNFERAEF